MTDLADPLPLHELDRHLRLRLAVLESRTELDCKD
jgi:hypothetical protein